MQKTGVLSQALAVQDAHLGDDVLISIVMPVYNTPRPALKRAVRSVLSQTHEWFELLLVDDGSDATCMLALESMKSVDKRVLLLNSGHMGVSHARNMAMDEARGEWVAFVDSDDELDPEFLQEALALALGCGADYVVGRCQPIYADEDKTTMLNNDRFHFYDDPSDLVSAARQMLGPMKYKSFPGPNYEGRGPVSKLYRTDLARSVRFNEDVAIGEDVLFNYRYIQKCSSILLAERVWYWYYQNEGSTVHDVDTSKWISSLDGLVRSIHSEDEKPELYTRCSYLASDAVSSFVRCEGKGRSKVLSIEVLKACAQYGCFDPPVLDGFICPIWFRIMVLLCRKGWYSTAYYFWAFKVKVADIVRRRKGLCDMSSVEEIDGGA